MPSSYSERHDARARRVAVSDETLTVELDDGRTISAPIAWFPRLWYATPAERARFQIAGDGAYIHWPDLDEDLTISGILNGSRSVESPESIKRWLEGRRSSQHVLADTVTNNLLDSLVLPRRSRRHELG